MAGKLSCKIITAAAVFVFLGILGAAIFSGAAIREYAVRNAENSINSLTRDVDCLLETVEITTNTAVRLVKDNFNNPERLGQITGSLKDSNGIIAGSRVSIDRPGMSSADKCGWSSPFFSIAYGEGAVSYSVPITNEGGEHIGRLISDVLLSSFASRLEAKHIYDNAYTVMMSREGVLLCYPDKSQVGEQFYTPGGKRGDSRLGDVVQRMKEGKTGFGELRPGNGMRNAAVFGPVSNGWSVAIVGPQENISGGLMKYNLILFLIALFDLLLLCIVTRRIIMRTLD